MIGVIFFLAVATALLVLGGYMLGYTLKKEDMSASDKYIARNALFFIVFGLILMPLCFGAFYQWNYCVAGNLSYVPSGIYRLSAQIPTAEGRIAVVLEKQPKEGFLRAGSRRAPPGNQVRDEEGNKK